MGDPVERMKRFVEERQQQARCLTARAAWAQKIPDMLPAIGSVLDVMRHGLRPDQFTGDAVFVLADPARDRFPLVIAFGPRTGGATAEVAASALFRCEADGRVHGYRYPFHSVTKGLDPEPFVDLGEPERLEADELGHAVADFLQWAAVGNGCGGKRLEFGAPSTLPFVRPQVKLSVVAA
jgi:hypothetical protein